MNPETKKKKILRLNLLFAACCVGILVFLFMAPPESTTRLPEDATHQQFYRMDKKEAEKHCETCHSPEGIAPLPTGHPPKYRCLLCHKKRT